MTGPVHTGRANSDSHAVTQSDDATEASRRPAVAAAGAGWDRDGAHPVNRVRDHAHVLWNRSTALLRFGQRQHRVSGGDIPHEASAI